MASKRFHSDEIPPKPGFTSGDGIVDWKGSAGFDRLIFDIRTKQEATAAVNMIGSLAHDGVDNDPNWPVAYRVIVEPITLDVSPANLDIDHAPVVPYIGQSALVLPPTSGPRLSIE